MSDLLVDALPYIDGGFDEPGVREAVLEMVAEETRRYKATKNYLENIPELDLKEFETDLMRNEFERLQNRQPMELLSMKRYELPSPSAGKMTDIWSWNECVDNSMAQLEHQAIRIDNLELMSRFGAEGWKQCNDILQQMLSNAQKSLIELRKSIQEVNWFRKSSQTNAGEKIKHLESEWVALVSKNYEIERQCLQLELEITALEQQFKLKNIKESIDPNSDNLIVNNGSQ
jgi:pre-mRNA-splicing factor SPF27